MEKLFTAPTGREVLIIIDKDHISFYHNDALKFQQRWVEQQREQGNEVSEEEEKVDEFYWIPVDEWRKNVRNWHSHMQDKNWFTDDMENFMNDNTIF